MKKKLLLDSSDAVDLCAVQSTKIHRLYHNDHVSSVDFQYSRQHS